MVPFSSLKWGKFTLLHTFYIKVKDVLDELWEVSKKVAKGVLEAAGYVVGAAVCVAAAPFYIVGNILGLWD